MAEVLLAMGLLFVVLLTYVALTMPKAVRISRSKVMNAPPTRLFEFINNPRKIQEWNPFVKDDPSALVQFTGPLEGEGASWSWKGSRAGAGSATIVGSKLDSRVELRLDFLKPFHVTNYGEYVLNPKGSQTEVTWTINESALIPRVMSRLVNLDRIIGQHFENGLSQLKSIVEKKDI